MNIGLVADRVLHADPVVILSTTETRPRKGRIGVVWLLVISALALWWAVVLALDLNPFFARTPLQVLSALTLDPDAAETRATLAQATAQTAVYLLPGYLAGLALGAGLAMLLVLGRGLSPVVTPVAVALRSIPIITTAPLIMLLLARGAVGTGLLVPPDDPAAFADALRTLLEQPALRQKTASAAKAAGLGLHDWTRAPEIVRMQIRRLGPPPSA